MEPVLLRAFLQLKRLVLPANVHGRRLCSAATQNDVIQSQKVISLVNNVIENKEAGRLFAVVQVCGKQFKVTDNDVIVVSGYWPPDIGDQIRLEKVLLLGSSDFTLLGRPLLPLNQVSVKATVIEKALTHTIVRFCYLKRTPGTGKSRLAQSVAKKCGLRWLDVSVEAINRGCCLDYDNVRHSSIMDEEMLLDSLEDEMKLGGVILDYHGCDFFPERWIDGVFVLRTNNSILYDRLTARGYPLSKVQENVSAEIFGTIADEAHESYREEIVFELSSDCEVEFASNEIVVSDWIEQWKMQRKKKSKH